MRMSGGESLKTQTTSKIMSIIIVSMGFYSLNDFIYRGEFQLTQLVKFLMVV